MDKKEKVGAQGGFCYVELISDFWFALWYISVQLHNAYYEFLNYCYDRKLYYRNRKCKSSPLE